MRCMVVVGREGSGRLDGSSRKVSWEFEEC